MLVAEELPKTPSFWSVNRPQERKKEAKADWVTWSYSPAVHLCDDDLLMENLPAVLDQARTVRSFAPQAKIRVSPVTIDFKGASPRSDPRNRTEFGAAWSAGLIRYLALGGADEAVFAVGPGPATAVQKRLGELAGSQVLATRVDAVGPSPIEALAVEGPKGRLLWLANKTAQPQRAAVGSLSLELAPFEVREIDLGR